MHTNTITEAISSNSSLLNVHSGEAKLFIHNDLKEAEKALNQWLKQNKVTIFHVGQSQSEKGGNFVFVITVFFRYMN